MGGPEEGQASDSLHFMPDLPNPKAPGRQAERPGEFRELRSHAAGLALPCARPGRAVPQVRAPRATNQAAGGSEEQA